MGEGGAMGGAQEAVGALSRLSRWVQEPERWSRGRACRPVESWPPARKVPWRCPSRAPGPAIRKERGHPGKPCPGSGGTVLAPGSLGNRTRASSSQLPLLQVLIRRQLQTRRQNGCRESHTPPLGDSWLSQSLHGRQGGDLEVQTIPAPARPAHPAALGRWHFQVPFGDRGRR